MLNSWYNCNFWNKVFVRSNINLIYFWIFHIASGKTAFSLDNFVISRLKPDDTGGLSFSLFSCKNDYYSDFFKRSKLDLLALPKITKARLLVVIKGVVTQALLSHGLGFRLAKSQSFCNTSLSFESNFSKDLRLQKFYTFNFFWEKIRATAWNISRLTDTAD